MPEAEDVLLHAADRLRQAVRERWLPPANAPRAGEATLAEEARRLGFWLASAFGDGALGLAACDASPRPSRLARLLGDRARWQDPLEAAPFCDGARIFLPRALSAGDGRDPRLRLLLMALGQARRAARGSLSVLPAEPRARDCAFALEGALADAFLAREWPGLARAIDAERAWALHRRPAGRVLRPAERGVEAMVRRLLAGSAADGARRAAELLGGDQSPAAVAREAQRLAAALPGASDARREYRGFAPVSHWGVPRADLIAQRAEAAPAAVADGEPLPAGARRALPRRVETRAADPAELEGRSGPFVLAFGDPELSVQDPAGLARPRDQGEEPELDALAEELAGLDQAARVRAPGAVRDVLVQEGDEPRGTAAAAARETGPCELLFPEWDRRLSAYRPDYCHVRVAAVGPGEAGFAERLRRERGPVLAQLRRRFETLRPRLDRHPRQLD